MIGTITHLADIIRVIIYDLLFFSKKKKKLYVIKCNFPGINGDKLGDGIYFICVFFQVNFFFFGFCFGQIVIDVAM